MKLVSVPEFTTGLIGTLEKKNLATDFRKRIVKPENTGKGATGRKIGPTTSARVQFTRSGDRKNTSPSVAPLEWRTRKERRRY